VPIHPAHARAGIDRRDARPSRARRRRRAAALLPDHTGWDRRGEGRSAAAHTTRSHGAREGIRARTRVRREPFMKIYDLLLRLYPASFRNEYGEEMRAVFARRRREADGFFGRAAMWLGVLPEVAGDAAL